MQYIIFCRKTHKVLATYTNKNTLKNLDLSRCYFKEKQPVIRDVKKLSSNEHLNPFSTHGR